VQLKPSSGWDSNVNYCDREDYFTTHAPSLSLSRATVRDWDHRHLPRFDVHYPSSDHELVTLWPRDPVDLLVIRQDIEIMSTELYSYQAIQLPQLLVLFHWRPRPPTFVALCCLGVGGLLSSHTDSSTMVTGELALCMARWLDDLGPSVAWQRSLHTLTPTWVHVTPDDRLSMPVKYRALRGRCKWPRMPVLSSSWSGIDRRPTRPPRRERPVGQLWVCVCVSVYIYIYIYIYTTTTFLMTAIAAAEPPECGHSDCVFHNAGRSNRTDT